jgi:hypothetical protein
MGHALPPAMPDGWEPRVYVVEQPYPVDLSTVPAQPGGAYQYNYRGGAHTLELFVPQPDPREVRDVESAPVEFALTIDEPAIYLLFRFQGWPWNYCSYSWHLVEDDPAARVLPPEPKDGASHAVLSIFLVDRDTGILRAMRACTFSRAFTKKLDDAMRAQARQPFDREAYIRHVDRIDDKRTTPLMVGKRLLARAVARTHGGD